MKPASPCSLSLLVLTLLVCCLPRVSGAPNIIVILADDAGYADFGFQGGGIGGDFAHLTPNIDSIAQRGVKFSSGYVSGPICCPSRAGLLTGRYQQRFGMEGNIQDEPNAGLPISEKTIANTLKALNYRTYAIGKWHLGQDLTEQHPNQRGFDEYYGFLAGGRTYFQYNGLEPAMKIQRNGAFITETPGQYLTDMFGREAAAYIDSHQTSYPAQPFFMYLAFNGVHAPLEADRVRLADPRIQSIVVPERKALAAMTIAVDDAVGAVLAKLEQRGLTNDTMIVFLSDNGGPEHSVPEAPNWSDNGPLRGNKTLLYEGGIRVPLAIKWPAGIARQLVGGTLADPVIALDLLPTFVAAANGSLLAGQVTDGLSLLPRLTGTSPTPLQRGLFWRTGGTGGQGAARLGDWKLYRGDSDELYNLSTDLGETTNLADSDPDRVAELVANFASWESEMVEPLWGSGEPRISNANLVRRPTQLGYELEKTGPGWSYMVDERPDPLSLAADWTLAWSMESVAVEGYQRNGSIVLGDEQATGRFIRVSVNFSSGAISITELQNNAVTSGKLPFPIPPGQVNEFRLSYVAATRTLTFQFGSTTLAHVLTGTYQDDLLDFSGYALQNTALTRFSPLTPHVTPLAPATSPTLARLKISRDYVAGSYDVNRRFMGGTETMALVSHKGKLFAGLGYLNDSGVPDPRPGPQVLVKPTINHQWQQDLSVGTNFQRIECLRSITITTDKKGVPLEPPVTVLLAGCGETGSVGSPNRAVVFMRNDVTGAWTPTYPGSVLFGSAPVRTLFDHVDAVTGVHNIFAGYGNNNATVVRGGYNSASGLIEWNSAAPELTGSQTIQSAGECNGVLYACIGSDGIAGNNNGGVFWRRDGLTPQWNAVYEWPSGAGSPAIRGFTAVPHPKGFNYDVALVALESFGKVYCIDPVGGDPRNGHIVTEELNIQNFLGDVWSSGASIGFPTIAAYNDMPEMLHPATMQPVNLIGLDVSHPLGDNSPEGKSAYFLIRHRDARYEWGRVFDPASATALKAIRTACVSPFSEDANRSLYFGGYDATLPAGQTGHNTAWIYRADLPNESIQIQPIGQGFNLALDTAYGWLYHLEYGGVPGSWMTFGTPLVGNNAAQSLLHNPPVGSTRQFYRWKITRP